MFGDFLTLAMDGIVNQAAKYFYISGEQASVPLVVRSAVGAGGRFGAIHSQMPASWFQNVPGLKIVAPSGPADAKALLKTSIRDENPVAVPRAQAPVCDEGGAQRRATGRAWPARHRRHLAADDARPSDPLQPAAGGGSSPVRRRSPRRSRAGWGPTSGAPPKWAFHRAIAPAAVSGWEHRPVYSQLNEDGGRTGG